MSEKNNKKILVGLSGGVDSAVAAYLLKQEGYDVTAGFMINYMAPEGEVCPTREDIEVAKQVAEYLEIPFFTFDYREEYEQKVLDYMYEGYKKGITPNPDIMCNSEIKFRVFLDEALELGFDAVATGHYARIISSQTPFLQHLSKSSPQHLSKSSPQHLSKSSPQHLSKSSPQHLSKSSPQHLSQFSPARREEAALSKNRNVLGNYNVTPEYVKELMKQLRTSQTSSEKKLWEILRAKRFHNFKFRRQHPFGRYIADFYCDEAKLVIELDGKIHENKKEYDVIRDEIIQTYGVEILRIENDALQENFEEVFEKIHSALSPCRRELERGVAGERIEKDAVTPEYFHLLKGIDANKDQSYFLAGLSQDQLSRSLFPIGHLEKSEVREIARKAGLPNAERKESQGICFVGKVDMKEFLQKKIPNSIGDIVDTSGKILGTHKGVFYYTIGQRKGLDVGGMPEPIFVVNKDIKNNRLIVGYGKDDELFSDTLSIDQLHFLAEEKEFPQKSQAKIRYRQADQPCKVSKGDDGKYEVKFETPQRAIASGQIIALYDGNELWGSGVIL